MLPVGAWLFTSMNPFAAKTWIGECLACHTSSSAEPTTIVPSRVLPDPAKRRRRRTSEGGAARWVEAGVEVFLAVAGTCEASLEVALCVTAPSARAVPAPPAFAPPVTVFPAATIVGPLRAGVWFVATVEL